MQSLHDDHARVREHAIRLAEPWARRSTAVQDRLLHQVEDPDQRVRYQLAFTLGEVATTGRYLALSRIVKNDARSAWMRFAVLSSLRQGKGKLLDLLVKDGSILGTTNGIAFLSELCRQIGAQQDPADLLSLARLLKREELGKSNLLAVVLSSATGGANQRKDLLRSRLAELTAVPFESLVQKAVDAAAVVALDEQQSIADRRLAIEVLRISKFTTSRELLTRLLRLTVPVELQQAAVKTLAQFDNEEVCHVLLDHLSSLSPATQRMSLDALFSRPAMDQGASAAA